MEDTDPLVSQCRARIGQQILGKYRLDALIGVGGMAAVYMATHRNGGIFAIKLLHPEVACMADVKERFLREAYIANKVGHEGTVKVLDDDVDDEGAPFLVMELLQGLPLDVKAEQRGGRLSIEETLDVLDQTLDVLIAAHSNQIIHRDLKPENLFITERNAVKVLDFGIARLREDSARRTQTGMVMGTPAFMSPEQAMGRSSDIDARTDIYAMGATAFTLLTGEPVHQADSPGEMLVAAATRPARSLARSLPDAPLPLIGVVDKALSYEREQRYVSAQAFRAAVQSLQGELSHGTPATAHSHTQVSAPGPSPAPAARAARAKAEMSGELSAQKALGTEETPEFHTFDPSTARPQDVAALSDVFTHLERALVATKQYGSKHPEPQRRFKETFKSLASALMSSQNNLLAWNLTPYGFSIGEHPIWEPDPPWNRIPYQLFSDGVRTMGFSWGLSEEEFARWLLVITLDPTTDLPLEDDLVTKLWDCDFSHAYHQAIDSFAEGNQDERAAYELRRKRVVEQARELDENALASAWQRGHGDKTQRGQAAQQSATVLQFLSGEEALNKATAARIQNLSLVDPTDIDVEDARRALSLDQGTQALLSARLDPDVGTTSERFVLVAAQAYAAATAAGRSQSVASPLRRALSGLSQSAGRQALGMLIDLRTAFHGQGSNASADQLFAQLTNETITAEVFSQILSSLAAAEPRPTADTHDEALSALRSLLPELGAARFSAIATFVSTHPPSPLRALLLDFLVANMAGHEPDLAGMFQTADFEVSMALLKAMTAQQGTPSDVALRGACRSPHALVRIEALGLMEGAGGVGVKRELRKLLEDPDPDVRLAALQAMQQYEIAAAGPYLVVRIREPDFRKLPLQERAQALTTLRTLRVQRCEELCIELLGELSWLRARDLESTRQLAATMLGEIARTDAAVFALEKAAKSRDLRHSGPVKQAAKEALARLSERVEEAERLRRERKPQAAGSSSDDARARARAGRGQRKEA